MKVVILAGGRGTRLSEETTLRPKPMVDIGGRPIIWHIMKIYAHFGYDDFLICAGYKSYFIKDYFANYFMHESDVTIDLERNTIEYLNPRSEHWKITIVDTGLDTMTGGRIERIKSYVGNAPFMMTYGDGLADIDLSALLRFHNANKKLATVTAVQPEARFGALEVDDGGIVGAFEEKPRTASTWINGGFFVLESGVFEYITDGDSSIWERGPLERLAVDGELSAYKHLGFWKPMDTMRDKIEIERLWKGGSAPWKLWRDQ